MDRQIRKAKREACNGPDAGLRAHLSALRLGSIDAYREWCVRNGFSRRTHKHPRQRQAELEFATRAEADARLARKKCELRRPAEVIDEIFRGEFPDAHATQPYLSAIFRAYQGAKHCRFHKQKLRQLLRHHTDLLRIEPVLAAYGWREGNSYVDALAAVARHWASWVRPLQAWKPKSHNVRRQFASLLRHLFARWPVPKFMDSVWFKGTGVTALRQQNWFIRLGRGENIRTADLPIPYTKRMAHHFMKAPADLEVESALRWGQVLAAGGSERLARAIAASRLGTQFDQDDFWKTVIGWFVANPMFDTAQVSPVIDFIHHQKFVSQVVVLDSGAAAPQGPPQPNLTMRGRTPGAIMRQVETWHSRLRKTEQPRAQWVRSGIREFEFVEGTVEGGNLKIWTIRELLSTKALFAEGKQMKHCVATYAQSCAGGTCSIWTLEVESFEGKRKILTIEVLNSTRAICQARGKCNALPGAKLRAILSRWAAQAGLQVGSHI
jgi:hypothetical protein